MADYTLFFSPGACSLAPHIVLEELGLPYEARRTVVAEGAQLKPEFLAVNPRARVPALVIRDAQGTRTLTEVSAILFYLAGLKPEAKLLPSGGEPLARAVEWLSWLGSSVHAHAFAQAFKPARFLADTGQHPALQARGRELLNGYFADLQERLPEQGFALGDYTVVDAYLLVFYRWGYRIGIDMRAVYPKYTRHAEAVVVRPAVQRTLQQENIVVWEN